MTLLRCDWCDGTGCPDCDDGARALAFALAFVGVLFAVATIVALAWVIF